MLSLENNKKEYELNWIDIIKPNFMLQQWRDMAPSFEGYFYRRCYGHAYIESVKTIVALKKFELKTRKLPDTLTALIPEYLINQPIDPFNGKILGYSKEKKWLYSVGNNFKDNRGGEESFYIRRCENDELCSENPTFPIIPNSVTF